MFSRSKILLGDKINNLFASKVIIFGIGGVGGYVAEMLARSGVGDLTLVDYDVVDVSNKNRQIIALDSTIGKSKVEAMRDRISDINSKCKVTIIDSKLTPENLPSFNLEEYDYVIDAIDMVASKIALIKYCKDRNIQIISAMGAGNRCDIPSFEVTDIYKTYNDGLAKVMRNNLRKLDIKSHTVVFTKNIPTANGDTIGSIAYYPAMCGCVLSAYVINELTK